MLIGRWCALALCAISLSPAIAQSGATPTQPVPGDVVVKGKLEKRSAWKRAESEHVVITSDGSEAELKRVSRNLELLYQLLSRIYRRGGGPDDTVKLQVTLFDSPDALRAMGLHNLRAETGPYLPVFSDPTYYDPREDGAVLAVARSDQIVSLNTRRAFAKDCDDYYANGGADFCSNASRSPTVPFHNPTVTTWEQMLYARFAQHFLLTYDPDVYPRWYLDGIGALFSTTVVGQDGSINYGQPPLGFHQIFISFGDPDIADILTGRYLDAAPDKATWTPAYAWLLAHYFLFSDLKPERSRQFQHYMALIRQGAPMAEAAKAFGDLLELQRDILRTVDSDALYSHAAAPPAPIEDPLITVLSPAGAALIEARIELDTPLGLVSTDARGDAATPTETAWLAQARAAADHQDDVDTILFAAEAECRSGHPDPCLADARRVLGRSPENVDALAWEGVALTGQAITGPVANRAETLADARKTLEHAIQIDGEAPLPLIAYFQSFVSAGEPASAQAILGMTRVIRRIPAAPDPRLYLAEELVRQGKTDLARRVIQIVLDGPYDSPEKKSAQALFAGGGMPRAGR